MLMTITLLIVAGVVVAWLISKRLGGADHSQYDTPAPTLTAQRADADPALKVVEEALRSGAANTPKMSAKERLAAMRAFMDDMGKGVDVPGRIIPVQYPEQDGGVRGEWIVPPGADPDRRMLYIHGGAFTMGSPLSHRAITREFATRLNVCVFALDYRLMPENPRQASIDDSRAAWDWIIDNGPDGPAPASYLLIAGDSAGGNLTLSTIAWARDTGRRAADAAIALSPATDSTFGSPSMRTNVETDLMLGPMMTPFLRLPNFARLLVLYSNARINPAHPDISPLHGDLHDLPPVLVHASSAEVLYDDAVRYVNKARAAGSPAELGVWPHMPHVWHAFIQQLPEASEAFDHIETFLGAATTEAATLS